jgi:hypothetical protein
VFAPDSSHSAGRNKPLTFVQCDLGQLSGWRFSVSRASSNLIVQEAPHGQTICLGRRLSLPDQQSCGKSTAHSSQRGAFVRPAGPSARLPNWGTGKDSRAHLFRIARCRTIAGPEGSSWP